jgi:hypothetical protein
MRAVLVSSLELLHLFLPLPLAVALRLHGQPLLRWIALTSVIFYSFANHWWFMVPMLPGSPGFRQRFRATGGFR